VQYSCPPADADADGVLDAVDLDDDNDGILDVDEIDCSAATDPGFSSAGTWTGNNVILNGDGFAIFNADASATGSVSQTLPNSVGVTHIETSFGWNNYTAAVGSAYAEMAINGVSYARISTPDDDGALAYVEYLNGASGTLTSSAAPGTNGSVIDNGDGTYYLQTTNYFDWTPEAVFRIELPTPITTSSTDISIDFTAGTGSYGSDDFGIRVLRSCDFDFDTDTDGTPDRLDLDSDNDGISDHHESGADAATLDSDGNGVIDGAQWLDADLDGLSDDIETTNGADTGTTPLDSNADAIDNHLDLDSDGDGIPDTIEARPTAGYVANDGNVADDDADGDGIIALFDSNDALTGSTVTLMMIRHLILRKQVF